MDPNAERLSRSLWIGVGLIIVILCLAFVLSRLRPSDRLPDLPVISQVADFALTNQSGAVVTLADLRGKVWVADIIFTRCAGPCPRLTRQMESLQAALPAGSTAQLVTLTTDPEFDTPEVLQRYAARFNANPARWHFLTGTKLQIAALAVDNLKLAAVEIPPEKRTNADDLFIHATLFVVVDKQGRMRGAFETDGEGVTWEATQSAILAAIRQLEREP